MTTGYRTIVSAPRCVELESQEWGSPGPGQALLRTERTLISTGTEMTGVTGDFPPESRWASYIRYPWAIGYSSVATVLRVGEKVEHVRPGDRVTSTAGHATHALYPADRLHRIPSEVESETATFATLAEIVMGGVRLSRPMFGESVAIIGAGLLGNLAAHFCARAGAWPIIVIDPAERRLESAARMGATHTLPLLAEQAEAEVKKLTKGRMADIVFDVTGNPIAMQGALRLARRMGRVVVLGSPRGPVSIDFHDEVHTLGLEIIGAHNMLHPTLETPHAPWTIARHIDLFLEWQAAGRIDVRPLITHHYPWRQTPDAFMMLLEDRSRALGVILDWSAGA